VDDRYTHGHHESVLRSHRWRTAENSAAHLLPHLTPGQRLLDVGCGPGTLTLDLAARVAPGPVLGIDTSAEVLAAATELAAERAGTGGEALDVTFAVDDVYGLDLPDAAVDVVHVHQVLQHLSDPVAALTELRRVVAPDGLVSVRESDFGAFVWAPADPRLDRWWELYHAVTRANGAEADAGRVLPSWFDAAGFGERTVTGSTWTFATPDEREWWGGLWADRTRSSAFAQQAVEYGLATADELAELAAAFHRWAAADDGVFVVVHVEVLARP
jgi:ubiquinone/menaquinone biosynthesis C-methylase UbiE